MNKRLESGFVVAVAALTVVTTATVMHDGNSGKQDALDRWVSSGLKRAASIVSNLGGRDAVHLPEVPAASPLTEEESGAESKGRATPSLSTSGVKPPQGKESSAQLPSGIGSLTSQDLAELETIGANLVGSVPQQDWQRIEQDLMTNNQSATQTDIVKVLDTHLSQSDKEWLTSHFTGAEAFSPSDITLLQQTVEELQNDLTPDEEQLLSATLEEYLSSHQFP